MSFTLTPYTQSLLKGLGHAEWIAAHLAEMSNLRWITSWKPCIARGRGGEGGEEGEREGERRGGEELIFMHIHVDPSTLRVQFISPAIFRGYFSGSVVSLARLRVSWAGALPGGPVEQHRSRREDCHCRAGPAQALLRRLGAPGGVRGTYLLPLDVGQSHAAEEASRSGLAADTRWDGTSQPVSFSSFDQSSGSGRNNFSRSTTETAAAGALAV